MINLLPPDVKKQLRAANINLALVRYIFFLVAGIIFLLFATGVSYMLLNNIHDNEEASNAQNNNSSAYNEEKQKLDTMINDMTAAKTILSSQVSYSKIISDLGLATPKGVVIDSLNLDTANIASAITLKAHAKSEGEVASLRTQLSTSPIVLRSDVQTTAELHPNNTTYPISVSISLTLNKGALQ